MGFILDLYLIYGIMVKNGDLWYRWPIEIDGLPINSMVDLSMPNC